MTELNRPNMESYEKTYNEFKWDVPKNYNFAWDAVEHWAAKTPNKTALITIAPDTKSADKKTFSDLSKLSNKFANSLKSLGLKKGDRVFLMLPRIPEWYIALLGMNKLGIIFMPTPTLTTGHDIDYRINSAEAVAVVTDVEGSEKIEAVADKITRIKHKIIVGGTKSGWLSYTELMEKASDKLNRSDVEATESNDPLLIYFTSGTTGFPKMVRHTQAYPIGHTVTAKYCQDLKSEDTIWVIADTGWAKTAWGKLFGQWIVGATITQWNQKGKFEPTHVLDNLNNYGITVFCAPPTVYRMITTNCDLKKHKFPTLRHSMSAGEPLNPEVIKVWKEATGLDIYDYYGQTETVALLGNYRGLPIRPGSMGKPTPGHVVEIVDDDGNLLPTGEEGHIAVKVKPVHSPGVFHGYWKADEKNEKVFIGDWYFTGDKAYKDKDGYFWFVGRSDDVIKASGYRIGPFEVESALQEHPAVQESAVIGVPDDVRGQIVKAFIILAPGFSGSDKLVAELQDHVKKTTAPYKYPREIEFVKELPKTISGKIKRNVLKEQELKKLGLR